jgi:hypothetical protein
MNPKLVRALMILEKAAEGKVGLLKSLGQATSKAGKSLHEAGHPLAGTAISLLPASVALYAGHKALQTGPGQALVNKYREYQYNKALQRAQPGYGY